MSHRIPRQHPFLRFLQNFAVTRETCNLKRETRLSIRAARHCLNQLSVSGEGGIYEAVRTPSTPFFAPSAVRGTRPKNRRNISAYRPSRTPKGSFRLAGRPKRRAALKDRPDPRQQPFQHPLQLLAQGHKTAETKALAVRPEPRKVPSVWQVVSKRRAALKDQPDPRQQPFCTLLQQLAGSRKLQCLKHNPDPAKLIRTSFSPEGLSRRRAASICRSVLRQQPFCTSLTDLAVHTATLPFWRKTLPC